MTLKLGSKGSAVELLQIRLNELGFTVPVTGNFDQPTLGAVIAFQSRSKLKTDGIAGPATLKALGLSLPQTHVATGRITLVGVVGVLAAFALVWALWGRRA